VTRLDIILKSYCIIMKKLLFLLPVLFVVWCSKQDVVLPDLSQLSWTMVEFTGNIEVQTWTSEIVSKTDVVPSDIVSYISSWDVVWTSDIITITWPLDVMNPYANINETWFYFKTYNSKELWFELSAAVYNVLNPTLYSVLVRSGNAVYFWNFWDNGLYTFNHIERLEKDTKETISQAIKRIFLNKSDNKCSVSSANDRYEYSNPDYKTFTIHYPIDTIPSCDDAMCSSSEYCGDHAESNAILFFMWQESADHFYFIDAGQDPLYGFDWNPWYTSIKLQ